jgi:uncharacterized membrane protein
MIANAIALFIENLPTAFFILALLAASFTRTIPQTAERWLSWILLSVGAEGLWAGTTHVFFPATAAKFIGWQVSPFQFEIGIADIALGVTAIVSFWRPIVFKTAVVTFSTVFFIGLAIDHIHQVMVTGNTSPGNFGLLLLLTIIRPLLLVVLLTVAARSPAQLKRP